MPRTYTDPFEQEVSDAERELVEEGSEVEAFKCCFAPARREVPLIVTGPGGDFAKGWTPDLSPTQRRVRSEWRRHMRRLGLLALIALACAAVWGGGI